MSAADSTHIAVLGKCFDILEIVFECLTHLRHIGRRNETENVDTFEVLKSEESLSINESGKVGRCSIDLEGSFLELSENVTVHGVEHIRTCVLHAYGDDHGVFHCFLIVVLEAVLSEENFVLLLLVRNGNALGVTLTYAYLLGTVGCGVNIDFASHTCGSLKRTVNGAELLQVEVRLELIFHLIREEEIAIASVLVRHYSVPPYNSLYFSGLFTEYS